MTVPKPLMDASSSTDELLRSVLASSSADDPSLEAVARVSGKLASALPAGALAVGAAGAGAGAGATAAVVSVKWLAVAALGGALVGAGAHAAVPRAPIAKAPSTAPSAMNAPATRAPLVESAAPAPAPASSATMTPSAARALPSTTRTPSSLAPSSSAGLAAPSETQLLDRAHDALLHGDPTAALALTSEHARLYRTGVLAQEREMIAIEALLALGRKAEATRRADAFRAAYPSSSHLTRLNALLGAP